MNKYTAMKNAKAAERKMLNNMAYWHLERKVEAMEAGNEYKAEYHEEKIRECENKLGKELF